VINHKDQIAGKYMPHLIERIRCDYSANPFLQERFKEFDRAHP
jgi:hypothetical protein